VWDLLAAAEVLLEALAVVFLTVVGMVGRGKVWRTEGRMRRWGRGARRGSGEPFVRPITQCHFLIVTWRRGMRTDAILSRSSRPTSPVRGCARR
jgi:hypothetical protein